VQNASTYNFGFSAGLNLVNDYPFGMVMPGRTFTSESCRYGFNGMEKDGEEWTGIEGSHLDFGARIYDSRLGRFFSIDPLSKEMPQYSHYSYAANNPIYFIDEFGLVPQKAIDRLWKKVMKMYNQIGENGDERFNELWNKAVYTFNALNNSGKDFAAYNFARYLQGKGGFDIFSVEDIDDNYRATKTSKTIRNTIYGMIKIFAANSKPGTYTKTFSSESRNEQGIIAGFFSCFGALNWINIPFAGIGLIIGIVGLLRAKPHDIDTGLAWNGITLCGVAIVVGLLSIVDVAPGIAAFVYVLCGLAIIYGFFSLLFGG